MSKSYDPTTAADVFVADHLPVIQAAEVSVGEAAMAAVESYLTWAHAVRTHKVDVKATGKALADGFGWDAGAVKSFQNRTSEAKRILGRGNVEQAMAKVRKLNLDRILVGGDAIYSLRALAAAIAPKPGSESTPVTPFDKVVKLLDDLSVEDIDKLGALLVARKRQAVAA